MGRDKKIVDSGMTEKKDTKRGQKQEESSRPVEKEGGGLKKGAHTTNKEDQRVTKRQSDIVSVSAHLLPRPSRDLFKGFIVNVRNKGVGRGIRCTRIRINMYVYMSMCTLPPWRTSMMAISVPPPHIICGALCIVCALV